MRPPRSELFRILLVGCLAVVVSMLTSVWYQSRHAGNSQQPAPIDHAAASPTAGPTAADPTSADPSPSPHERRQATISLAAVAIPATAESLQLEAEQVAGELLSRFPDLPEALHVSALVHARLRQTAQAEKLWTRCVELAPRSEPFRINLAAVAMERGNNELAADTLLPVATADGASPDLSHHLALALTNLGRSEEAEKILTKTLQRHPNSAAHWLVLGQAQLKLGKAAEAEASLRKALELGVQSPELYFALGAACARSGKEEEASQFRQRFAELKASQPLSAQERFQVLTTAESRQTAVAAMIEAATVHAWQQDSQEAERLLLRAIAIDPGNIASYRALAKIYEQGGLLAEQRVVVERLVQIEPQKLDNYRILAQLATQLGEPAAAEAALKLAISVEPQAAAPYTALAQFYLQEGKAARQARWYAQEAVRRLPTAEGYRLLASTCRLLKDDATAEAALAKARELEASQPRRSQQPAAP